MNNRKSNAKIRYLTQAGKAGEQEKDKYLDHQGSIFELVDVTAIVEKNLYGDEETTKKKLARLYPYLPDTLPQIRKFPKIAIA